MKVIMIGPTKGGKSSIADFVAEMSPSLGREAYDPTIGVRYVLRSLQVSSRRLRGVHRLSVTSWLCIMLDNTVQNLGVLTKRRECGTVGRIRGS
jgi:hypothetical protein